MSLRGVIGITAAACAACAACGAGAHGPDSGASAVTLTVPLGSYVGCTSNAATVAANFEGTTGGSGTVTLAQQGDGVVATLAFEVANGTVTFAPATVASATFTAGQLTTVDETGSNASMTATTGSLALVGGDTLFISLSGTTAGGTVTSYVHCPVPASLPLAQVTANARSSSPPAGAYGSCTASLDAMQEGGVTGGAGTVTITGPRGNDVATWTPDLLAACETLEFSVSATGDATLAPGQTCDVPQPCGPPPELGTSTAPLDATMTNMMGAMTLDAHALFISAVGDTSAQACGRHYIAIACAP